MMTRKFTKLTEAGVSLVEMLIVMGLLAIFLVVITTVFTASIDTQNQSTGYSATTSDGRFIMARLNFDIMRATAICTPASIGASASSLVLSVGGSCNYTYALSGSNLQLNDGGGAVSLNSSDSSVANTLTFQRIGNAGGKDTIRYSFTLTSNAKHSGGNDTQVFTSTAERR